MPELKSLSDWYLILGLIVPGLIIIFVRSRFLTGRTRPHSEACLSYLTLSLIYYALVLPAFKCVAEFNDNGLLKSFLWFLFVFLVPALLGVLLGADAQYGLIRRLLQAFGLNPVHVIPTAWDWKFGNTSEQWVLITLKNGTRFAGFMGRDLFASSEPIERDIYIERIYDLDDDNQWLPCGEKSALISGNEIRTIEFWPFRQEGGSDERRQEVHAVTRYKTKRDAKRPSAET